MIVLPSGSLRWNIDSIIKPTDTRQANYLISRNSGGRRVEKRNMSAARITPSTAMPVNTIMLCGKAVK